MDDKFIKMVKEVIDAEAAMVEQSNAVDRVFLKVSEYTDFGDVIDMAKALKSAVLLPEIESVKITVGLIECVVTHGQGDTAMVRIVGRPKWEQVSLIHTDEDVDSEEHHTSSKKKERVAV